MTLNKLASKIARLEGKRSQARIGDIREILAILGDICCAELDRKHYSDCFISIIDAGYARMKRKKKTKKRGRK